MHGTVLRFWNAALPRYNVSNGRWMQVPVNSGERFGMTVAGAWPRVELVKQSRSAPAARLPCPQGIWQGLFCRMRATSDSRPFFFKWRSDLS
jgi:hypothetical protein